MKIFRDENGAVTSVWRLILVEPFNANTRLRARLWFRVE